MWHRIFFWPLFAFIMGFALGGSVIWAQQSEPSYQAGPTEAKKQDGHADARQHSVTQKQQHGGHGEGHWYDTFLDHAPDWFVAIFTGLLVYVTYRLVVSTNRLWQATKDAAERQVRDTEILQRAYLAVEPHGVTSFVAGTPAIGHVAIKNVGNLPARNVRWFIRMEMSSNRNFVPMGLKAEGNFSVPGVVPPGSEMRQDDRRTFTVKEIDYFMREEQFVFVWGVVTYHDGFQEGRWTNFCHRYERRGWVEVTDSVLPRFAAGPAILNEGTRYHELGNDAG